MDRLCEARALLLASCLLGATLIVVPGAAAAPSPGLLCARAAAAGLSACVRREHDRLRICALRPGIACERVARSAAQTAARMEAAVLRTCGTPEARLEAGVPEGLDAAAFALRLRRACEADAAAGAARALGGPKAAALRDADPAGRRCLDRAAREGAAVALAAFRPLSRCARLRLSGRACDPAAEMERLGRALDRSTAAVARACPDLEARIGLDPATFVERAARRARCLVPAAHGAEGAVGLDCGPRPGPPELPPAATVQIVLGEESGARCGDGSPYAFLVRRAPAGAPAERVLVALQGGGVCLAGDCASRPPGLFRSLDNTEIPTGGILDPDPARNPFAEYTLVYLPYCTQDVFLGGGAVQEVPGLSLHRNGALDVRAALETVRDLLWRELDAAGGEGYRPDRLRVLFGGFSAGGFGTVYNLHFVLDELGWVHTTAWPDAALGLDNESLVGLRGLVPLATAAWGSLGMLPPYCLRSDCGVVPELLRATSERLLETPDQQVLVISNQVDDTQVSTTFFPDRASFVNALRAAVCDLRGLPGLHFFLPASPTSIHVLAGRDSAFHDLPAGGISLREFLLGAVADPAGVVDRIEEGDLVALLPGVAPFPCGLP